MKESEEKTNHPRQRGFRWSTLVILIILALAAAAAVFFVRGGFVDQNDPKVVADRVAQHIILPDEEPSVTTVEKASELSSQAFFSEVKDGDKILIYARSARIIIYRPSENILVNVGPIVDDATSDSDGDASGSSATTTPQE